MKKIGRFITMLTFAAILLCAQMVHAYAASSSVTAEIPVKVILNGEAPEPAETYSIVLKPDSRSCPMPAASGKEDVLEIKGAGEACFYIDYAYSGIYTYTVSQTSGTNEKCSYDSCVYEVTVYVTNSEAEAGALDVVVKAENGNAQGTKCAIEFTNTYLSPEPVKPAEPSDIPNTGDESNLPLYFAMAGGSAFVLTVLFLTRKKKKNTDEE